MGLILFDYKKTREISRKMTKSWPEELLEPLNLAMLAASGYFLYKILCDIFHKPVVYVPPPKLEKDMTVNELRAFDGIKEPYICIGIKGEIYDVSRGKSFYGPGGPYHAFAGHDASRAFASFSTDPEMFKDEDDNLSNLTSDQLNQLNDWYESISMKYDKVGVIIKQSETKKTE